MADRVKEQIEKINLFYQQYLDGLRPFGDVKIEVKMLDILLYTVEVYGLNYVIESDPEELDDVGDGSMTSPNQNK